ncbi:MAG: hypothetical protein JKY95_15395, partial [Planctomycetaceae bacterium]|nr:hypothetical protein [Planctomycetaceae bacterium]
MKKKAMRKKSAASNKTRIELRFDNDVAEKVQSLADQVGVSVNQLMQGMARWMIQYGIVGEPRKGDAEGQVMNHEQEGCVWFGKESRFFEAWELKEMEPYGPEVTEGEWGKGEL